MVPCRRLATAAGSLLIIVCVFLFWNTSGGLDVSVVSGSSISRESTTSEDDVSALHKNADDVYVPSAWITRPLSGDSTMPTPMQCPMDLALLPRHEAEESFCDHSVIPPFPHGCLSWATFPPMPKKGAVEPQGGGCAFLCNQASQSRPAVWQQSMIRSHAIVEVLQKNIPSSLANSTSCRQSQLISPKQCVLQQPHGAPPVSVLFIGHSHTRFLASMICMMLNASSCEQLDDQFRNISIVRQADLFNRGQPADAGMQQPHTSAVGEGFVRLAFVQANYHFGNKVALTQQAFTATELAAFTHVVVSRGSWDLLFYDRPPVEIAVELRSSLRLLLGILSPRVHLILHQHHFVHPKSVVGGNSKKRGPSHAALRAAWRRLCFSTHRVERIRDATLCGAWNVSSSPSSSIAIYDTYPDTRTALGYRFVDVLGHHYQDVMLEHLTMKFLRDHVCSRTQDRGLMLTETVALDACKRTDAASGDGVFHTIPDCACHHPTERRDHICKRFGRSVPDVSRRG